MITVANTLLEIRLKFDKWDDILSKRMSHWCDKYLRASEQATKELPERSSKSIYRLVHKILVNPLNEAPLNIPYLDGKWTWEKSMLDDWLSLDRRSPFDGQAMESRPHAYAQAMLNWVRSLSFPLHGETGKELVPCQLSFALAKSTADSQQERVSRMMIYVSLAQTARMRNDMRCYKIARKADTRRLMLLNAQSAQQEKERTEASIKMDEAHDKTIECAIESIQRSQKCAVDSASTLVALETERHKQTQGHLRESERKAVDLTQQAANLQSALDQTQRQLQGQ